MDECVLTITLLTLKNGNLVGGNTVMDLTKNYITIDYFNSTDGIISKYCIILYITRVSLFIKKIHMHNSLNESDF